MCKVVDCLFFKKRNFFLRAGRPSEKGYFTFFLFIFLTNFFQGLSILRNCFKGHVGLEIFVPREFVSKVIKGISDPQNKVSLLIIIKKKKNTPTTMHILQNLYYTKTQCVLQPHIH